MSSRFTLKEFQLEVTDSGLLEIQYRPFSCIYIFEYSFTYSNDHLHVQIFIYIFKYSFTYSNIHLHIQIFIYIFKIMIYIFKYSCTYSNIQSKFVQLHLIPKYMVFIACLQIISNVIINIELSC